MGKGQQLLVIDSKDKEKMKRFNLYPHVEKVSLSSSVESAVVLYTVVGRQGGIKDIDFSKVKLRKKWIANSAVYFTRTQIAALTTHKTKIMILDPNGSSVKKGRIPKASTLFAASGGCVYIVTEEKLILFHVYREQVLEEAAMPFVKSVVLNKGKTKSLHFHRDSVLCKCKFKRCEKS